MKKTTNPKTKTNSNELIENLENRPLLRQILNELTKQTDLMENINDQLLHPQTDLKTEEPPGIKLRAIVMLEILKKINISTAHNDLSKICKLIAFITGNSYNSIYKELQKGVTLSQYHEKHIQNINNNPETHDWIDSHEVMKILRISKRTLQMLRNNGTIPYSTLGKRNFYYQREDISKILSDNYTLNKIRKSTASDTHHANPEPSEEKKTDLLLPLCSFFKAPISNTIPHKNATLRQIYNAIKGDYYQERTQKPRAISGKIEARKFKAQNFDYCTFSGTFSSRNDKALIKHSGLLCLDFDHLADPNRMKQKLLTDQHLETQLLFISPSSDGLKWIISINQEEMSHANYFATIASYIQKTYGFEIDKSGKDISRACFLPHDPNAYFKND